MAKNRVGSLRRSHVVGTYGPGAIVDFRTKSGAPVSGVIAGLDEWDSDATAGKNKGLSHDQVIHEPRLQKRLYVDGFRLPPVRLGEPGKKAGDSDIDVLPIVRFPEWLQCTRCDRIDRAERWGQEPGNADRWCTRCSDDGSHRA